MCRIHISLRTSKMHFLSLLIGVAVAFTPYQVSIIRTQQVIHKAPPRSGIVDAVLAQDYAFTDQIKTLTHIDGIRFECCPNTFTNVITHEIHHQSGRQHTTGVKGDPMSYVLTVKASGEIVEDNFVLPPLSANQPWAAQILNQGSSTTPSGPPVSVESKINEVVTSSRISEVNEVNNANSVGAAKPKGIRRLPVQVLSERLSGSTAGFGQAP